MSTENSDLILSTTPKVEKKRKAGKVKLNDLTLFSQQLAAMTDAGLPLIEALESIVMDVDPKKQRSLKIIIEDIIASVQDGTPLHEALAAHPQAFNRLYCSMIKAGEAGGILAEVLKKLASFLESTQRLRSKIKAAIMYPLVVVSLAFILTVAIVVFLVPVFADIFAQLGAKLPLPTRILINISDFIRGEWYYILPIATAAVYLIRRFFKSKKGNELWDKWRIRLPIFGHLAHKIALARFAGTFAQLERSGLPILEILDVVAETAGNCVIRDAIKVAAVDIADGDSLAKALRKHPVFPRMLTQMIAAGQKTGKIEDMFDTIAAFWNTQVETALAGLTSLIEPLLIVFLGLVIGGIAAAIYLPLFKMSEVLFTH